MAKGPKGERRLADGHTPIKYVSTSYVERQRRSTS